MCLATILASDFSSWWDSLEGAHRFFLLVGISSGIVAMFLVLGGVLGFGHDAPEMAVDHGDSAGDAEGFSLRAVTGFFLAFGWGGAGALGCDISLPLSILIALMSGIVVMLGVQVLMKSMRRLRSDGTMNPESAVGAEGQVYVSIPPAGATGGQVVVTFSKRQETLPAVQTGETPLPSGTRVKVLAVSGRVLTVAKL